MQCPNNVLRSEDARRAPSCHAARTRYRARSGDLNRKAVLAERILTAQFEASTFFDSSRLPELFCGFRRREGKAPTSYPVACSPQAWAAGAVFMMLQACLGLTVDATKSRVLLRSPCLPECLDRVCLRGISVDDAGDVDLTVIRSGSSVAAQVDRRSGKLEVVVLH